MKVYVATVRVHEADTIADAEEEVRKSESRYEGSCVVIGSDTPDNLVDLIADEDLSNL